MEDITTEAGQTVAPNMKAPFVSQDRQQVAQLVQTLESHAGKGKKGGYSCKRAEFIVENSPNKIAVHSWRFQEWDYKKDHLPTYARGLFTTKSRNGPEIVIRGYDKFFNVGETRDTEWKNIQSRTRGLYELTLKENGCIIFIGGLEDGTLLVTSKHSTGSRGEAEASHAVAGEQRLEAQLRRLGKTKEELARELRARNVTAVAELCDDSFEEHILAYTGDEAGLYLHGMNLNLPEFATYPSPLVQDFADAWGFKKVGLQTFDDVNQVQAFLEDLAETGAYEGRDVEGFVIRCKMSRQPNAEPFEDWFFKYKFEEPYLMYRQWRECTKSMIAGRQPKIRKHVKITEEYLAYARQRLQNDGGLAKAYNQNHGIIALRNDFLSYKNLKGVDAANMELEEGGGRGDVSGDVVLVPIATIGCGKTTVAVALAHLFGWGHVQNDNISGPKRPPRFVKMLMDELDEKPVVFADRNNAEKRERQQIITDVKQSRISARLVALHFVHNDMEEVRRTCQERVFARGDNHQTIQAASDMNKVRGIMENFINRFQPAEEDKAPDDGFDDIIDLDPSAGSRKNLEIVVQRLHRIFPKLIPKVPSAEKLDEAIQYALDNYKPDLRHTIPDRKPKNKNNGNGDASAQQPKKEKPKSLEYMSVDIPTTAILSALDRTFAAPDVRSAQAKFWRQLNGTRRVQQQFHVTLMHRASSKDHPELWNRYLHAHEARGSDTHDGRLGELNVLLERVVFDNRIMAIVVRLEDVEGGTPDQIEKWECVNRIPHITIGTADDKIKPKESNDMLAKWLNEGHTDENKIEDLVIEGKPVIKGVVHGVLSR
jgi:tRNA ligase